MIACDALSQALCVDAARGLSHEANHAFPSSRGRGSRMEAPLPPSSFLNRRVYQQFIAVRQLLFRDHIQGARLSSHPSSTSQAASTYLQLIPLIFSLTATNVSILKHSVRLLWESNMHEANEKIRSWVVRWDLAREQVAVL